MKLKKRLIFAVTTAVVVSLGFSGCSGAKELPVSASYRDLNVNLLEAEFQLIADCVEERTGFALRVTRGGYIEYTSEEVPPEQSELVTEVLFGCDAELIPQAPKEVSDDLLAKFYSLQNDARACIINAGYSVPQSPSEATFVDQFRSGSGYWSPYDDALEEYRLDETEGLDLLKLCPEPSQFYWR